jgi:hypothetical protein
MTTKEHDTDPSTPSARRPNKMRSSAPPPPADTDPGLAPPPVQTDPPSVPLGIKVPSTRPPPIEADSAEAAPVGLATNEDAQKGLKKDSVELLLEGMAELRLDRSRTTPQTDGQASASYHAEHEVRALERPPPEPDQPKVLLEQPPTVTVRLVRGASLRPGEADPTWIRPEQTLRRVFLALAAGLAVVIAIFVWLQASSRSDERAQESAAKPGAALPPAANAPPVVPPSGPVAAPLEAPAATAAAGASTEATAAASASAASVEEGRAAGKTPASRGAAAAASGTRSGAEGHSGHRTKATPAAAATTDVGEFKTTY